MLTNDGTNRDRRTVAELIQLALREQDTDGGWEAVDTLHFRGTVEVLARAVTLCQSPVAAERVLGADILGQLGVPDRTFPRQCCEALLKMLETEEEADVLQSIFMALNHVHEPEAILPAIGYLYHPDDDVRHAVALTLTSHDDSVAINGLITLTNDPTDYVREWATFGLGTQIEKDTPEIRHALAARLEDADDYTRGEAIVGLVRRRDRRGRLALERELALGRSSYLIIDAAKLT